jgi:hypothetical protein
MAVILTQSAFIFFTHSMFHKERKQLIDRIMAKNFIEYTNSELAMKESDAPKKKEAVVSKIRI